MLRRGGWRREGSRGRFRYLDSRGKRITDEAKLARIETLVIPPAWKDVRISASPTATIQATGVDAAGRRQYLYHEAFREQQEEAKYERLARFAEHLPELRAAMSEHMDRDSLDGDRVSAIAMRLIDLGWFRVGSERYMRESRTYGRTPPLPLRMGGRPLQPHRRAPERVHRYVHGRRVHGEGFPHVGRDADGSDCAGRAGDCRDGSRGKRSISAV